jgi:branched-chain amino acid transport system ATP-binding protein
MFRPTEGQIIFRGEDITSRPAHEIVLLGIVHIPEGRRLFSEMTVLENLLLGSTHAAARKHRKEGLEHVFSLFPILRDDAPASIHVIGRATDACGCARRCRCRGAHPHEPSLGLAPRVVTEILNVIRSLNEWINGAAD